VTRDLFEGCIAGGGFASGHAVIIGAWRTSPFGTFVDVMWRRPDGERVLLAPTPSVASYVALRPRFLRRRPWWIRVEDRLARPVVGLLIGGGQGVRAAGIAPGGQREYYSVDDYRRVVAGELSVDGRDAGTLGPLPADLGVGLSAFPTVPAVAYVGTIIEGSFWDAAPAPPAWDVP